MQDVSLEISKAQIKINDWEEIGIEIINLFPIDKLVMRILINAYGILFNKVDR